MSHPKNESFYSKVSINKTLTDIRQGTRGQVFGKVGDLANQYGVEMVKSDSGVVKFSAPASRLQIFLEKFHFSGTPYSIE
jgi:hypothetical protein